MKTVSIDLADKSPVVVPERKRTASALAKYLTTAGYELIELKGLQQFRPKFRDAQPWDAVALPADSDAESLITAYDGLLRKSRCTEIVQTRRLSDRWGVRDHRSCRAKPRKATRR